MDSNNGRKIVKLLSSLCQNTTDLETIMSILWSTETLEESELTAIHEINVTSYEKNYALYTKLINKANTHPHAFTELCNALKQTNQEHLVDKMNQVDVNNILDETVVEVRMSRKERQTICKNAKFIANNVTSPVLMEILTILVEKEALKSGEVEEIKSNNTTENKVIHLITKLLDKKPNPFPYFIFSLRKTNNLHTVNQILTDLNNPNLEYEMADFKEVLDEYRICNRNFIPILLKKNKWFDVNQPPIKEFTGRTKILEQINDSIKDQQLTWENEQRPKLTVICGLGGVGKSQAVRKYIYTYHRDNNVIWINAKDYLTTRESFFRLAENELGFCTKQEQSNELKPIRTIVNEVYGFFSDQKTLFIFDNAENFIEDRDTEGIDQFLPMGVTTHIHPCILITSQNKNWDSPLEIHVIELTPFTKSESMQFIQKSLGLNNFNENDESIEYQDEFDDIVDLANLIKGLPLALHQAVDFIKQNKVALDNLDISYAIREYLHAFEEQKKKILNHKTYYERISSHNHPHINTVYLTAIMSLKGMKEENYGDEAEKLLNIIAYFHYQDLPSRLLLDVITERKRLCLALELLKKYSFITVLNGMIQIHSVTQEVIRINLQDANQEQAFIDKGMQLLKSKFPTDTSSILSEHLHKSFFSHAVSNWDFGVNYPDLVRKYSEYFVKMQGFLTFIGNPKKATKWSSKTKQVIKLNPNDPYDPGMLGMCSQLLNSFMIGDNQATQNTLSQLVSAAGQVDPAESAKYGNRDQTALGVINSLAKYTKPGDKPLGFVNDKNFVSSAIPTLEAMLNSETASPDATADDKDAFSVGSLLKTVLAGLHSKAGDNEKAYKNLSEINTSIKGAQDSSDGMHYLSKWIDLCRGMCLQDMGKHTEASVLLEQQPGTSSSGKNSKNNEYESPKVNMNNLQLDISRANALKRSGKLDEAFRILTDARKSLVKEYTESHPFRFQIDTEIGTVLIAQNKFQESYDFLSKTCKDAKLVLDQHDRNFFSPQLTFIWTMHMLNRNDDAILAAMEVQEAANKAYGHDNGLTKEIERIVALLLGKKDTELLD